MIETKRILTAFITSLTLITLTAQDVLSDEHIGVIRQPLRRQRLITGFALQNDSTRNTIVVNVSKDFNNWKRVRIAPQSTHEFSCTEDKYVYIITRDSGEVKYRIDCDQGRRYSVAWNRDRKLWDVYRLLE